MHCRQQLIDNIAQTEQIENPRQLTYSTQLNIGSVASARFCTGRNLSSFYWTLATENTHA